MRKPVVSRTLVVTELEVLTADVKKDRLTAKTFRLARTYRTEEKALSKARQIYEKKGMKLVSVLSMRETTRHFEMPEQEFIQKAKLID